MTKQPTKEIDVAEIIALELRVLRDEGVLRDYMYVGSRVRDALVQAGVIKEGKEYSKDDKRCCDNGYFNDGHQCLKQPTEPKAIWVCEDCNTTFKTKKSFDEHQNSDYAQCIKKPILYFPQQDFNSLQAQHTQALRRIAKLQDALIRTRFLSAPVNPGPYDINRIYHIADDALTTDDEGEE